RFTDRALAETYHLALNAPQAVAVSDDPRHQKIVQSSAKKREEVQVHVAKLSAEKITTRSNQEVRVSVVPVLTNAIRTAKTVDERKIFLAALAALGPAADQALPVLEERLTVSRDEGERRAVLRVIDSIGPSARSAAPVLAMFA